MTPSTTTAAPQTPAQPTAYRARLAAAASRAMAEGITARKNADGTWSCKQYLIVPTGPKPQQVRCNCPAGWTGLICKHVVGPIWGRKYGVLAVTAKPKAVPAPSPITRPAASEEVRRSPEYLAAMAELIQGVDIWV